MDSLRPKILCSKFSYEAPMTVQDRAHTNSTWYTPNSDGGCLLFTIPYWKCTPFVLLMPITSYFTFIPMKKLSIILTAIIMAQLNVNAQSDEEGIDMIQSIFGMEKKEMYVNFITAKGQVADNFWTLYDEYEVERKVLGKNRINL